MKDQPRLKTPYKLVASSHDPKFKDEVLDALDACTAVRRISASHFALAAVAHFLTLPAYQRDQHIRENQYAPMRAGRPSKEDRA